MRNALHTCAPTHAQTHARDFTESVNGDPVNSRGREGGIPFMAFARHGVAPFHFHEFTESPFMETPPPAHAGGTGERPLTFSLPHGP